MKGLVTDVTFVLFLGAVREFVILIVPLLVEPLPAVLALERLVAQVDPHVGVEG